MLPRLITTKRGKHALSSLLTVIHNQQSHSEIQLHQDLALLDNLISYKGPNMYLHMSLFQLTHVSHNAGFSRNQNKRLRGTRVFRGAKIRR